MTAALAANAGWAAETSRTTTGRTSDSSAARRSGSAKGPLPDPALLDGANQAAEKKSEYGMIGEFELPGDENAKDGKVGGQQNPNGQGAGGQNGNPAMALPQGAGGGGSQAQQKPPQGAGAQGGQQGGGPENPDAKGNAVGGAGEAGAQPQGIQVAELGGNPSGQQASGLEGNPGGKPQPVAIGDKAMRIEQAATPAGVIGAQQKIADGHVQQHDKTGTGGKAPTSPQGPGRIEKGRAIPAGL